MTNPPPPGDPNQWGTPPPPDSPPPPPQWQPQPPAPQKNQYLWLYIVFGVVAALVIGGGVWIGVAKISESKGDDSASAAEPKAEISDGGIVLGDGDPKVDIYVDFGCPACKKFQNENGDALAAAIEDKKATIRFHPLGFLDGSFTDEYPSRAAAASVCAADEGEFYEYYRTLMENQPAEGGAGHDDAKLADLGADVGLGSTFADCVEGKTYRGWVKRETDKASDVSATPTIFIDGEEVKSTEFAAEFGTKTA